MQRTGEVFGVRAPIWIGAFVAAFAFLVAVQVARQNAGSHPKRTESIVKTPPVLETISPAPGSSFFPSNGSDPAFAKLLQQFSDPDADVRLNAAEALEKLEMPNTERISLLSACLSDSDPRIRAHAALKLGSFRVAAMDAVPILKQLEQTESDELVRARVKDALFNIRMYDYSPFMRDL